MNKTVRKWVSLLVMAFMLFSSFGVAFGNTASAASDINGHWAEKQMRTWIERGNVLSDDKGNLKPDMPITRAEFMALINHSFDFTESADIYFMNEDEVSLDWIYVEVARAIKAGYITGDSDGAIRADQPISRQEAAVILNKLLNLPAAARSEALFTDASLIANWATSAVNAAAASGILTGYKDKNSFSFMPMGAMTRAEAITALDRALSSKVVTYDKAGTYGPEAGIETINKDIVIHTRGVTLQNMIINGKLTFGAGIGDGDAFLNNVTVKGETIVRGGGEHSDHITSSNLSMVTIDTSLPSAPRAYIMQPSPPSQVLPQIGGINVNVNPPPVPTVPLAPGLHLSVTDGAIIVTNHGGALGFNAGQFGYVPSINQPPIAIPENPSIQFIPPSAFNSNISPDLVHVVADEATTIDSVVVNSPSIFETTGQSVGSVTLTDQLPIGSTVTLIGDIGTLEIIASDIHVIIPEGSVQTVIANETATGLTLELGDGATIDNLGLNVPANLLGTGTINQATLTAAANAGSTFKTQPKKITPIVDHVITIDTIFTLPTESPEIITVPAVPTENPTVPTENPTKPSYEYPY